MLGCLVLLTAGRLLAHDLPNPETARFLRVDSSKGLTQDSAMSLAQDHRGYLWIGTQDGLNRWDGQNMTSFRADGGPGAIGGNWVSRLLHDPRGWLWVGTSAGLYRHHYASERFEAVPLSGGNGGYVYDIVADASGAVWIGSDSGLTQWAGDGQKHEHFPSPTAPLPDTLPDTRIRAIAGGAGGRLWLGTTAGLRQFDPVAGQFLEAPAPLQVLSEPINDVHLDTTGRLWIAADFSGVWRSDDPEGGAPTRVPDAQDVRTYRIEESADGTLWIGTEDGVLAFENHVRAGQAGSAEQHVHRPYDSSSLGRGRVRAILDAGPDGLWFGTWDGGASGLHAERSRLLSVRPDGLGGGALLHPSILSVRADGPDLWLGTMRGVYRVPGAVLPPVPVAGGESVSSFALAIEGQALLLGTDQGLQRLDPATGDLGRAVSWPGLDAARIRRVLLDQGRIWLYAEPLGVHVFEDRSQAPVAVHAFASVVNHITVLEPDHVVVSASDGLYWFSRDGRELRHITRVGSDPHHALLAGRPSGVLEAADGRRWISLYGVGLAELRWSPGAPLGDARFVPRLTPPRLANAGVNSMLEDARGRLWLTTDRGVTRFDPSSDEVLNFDGQDGALTRGYYFSAAAAVSPHRFAFGSKDGLTLFDPLAELPPRPVRPPRLNAIERDGVLLPAQPLDGSRAGDPVAVPELTELRLAPGEGRSLLFRFASPDLVAPQHLRYRFRLEGMDETWREVDAERAFAGYGNLPRGRFVLRLQAVSREGETSEERLLLLDVQPHWWQTWWARACGVLLVAWLGVLAYQLRVRHLRRNQRMLEERVAERTRVAEEARHRAEEALEELSAAQQELVRAEKLSALGQLVSGVAHEVNTPLGVAVTASSHFSEAVRGLRRRLEGGQIGRREFEEFMNVTEEASDLVQRNLERASDLIRSFKQVSVDRSSDGRRRFELAPFLADLTASLRLLWKHRPLSLQIDCEPNLGMDSFPGALGQVLTNLVQNALLHAFADTHGGVMRIEARRLVDHRVLLVFSDNGKGMSAESRQRAFEPFFTTRRGSGGTGLGLHIVHNLVCDKLGGSIRLHSVPGEGTRFEIELPTRSPGGP